MRRLRNLSFLLAQLFLLVPRNADAHVKWFVPFDVSEEPLSIAQILSPGFIWIALLGGLLTIGILVVDRNAHGLNLALRRYRLYLLKTLPLGFPFSLLRFALVVFFTAIWTLGDIILTPGLHHSSVSILFIQVLVVLALIDEKTTYIAAIGIVSLWLSAM